MANNNDSHIAAGDPTSSLLQHIFTLAQQANEQLLQLALTVDAHFSLGTDVMDDEDPPHSVAPPTRIAVLRRALRTEMKQQLKALALTTDALYVCAEAAAGLHAGK